MNMRVIANAAAATISAPTTSSHDGADDFFRGANPATSGTEDRTDGNERSRRSCAVGVASRDGMRGAIGAALLASGSGGGVGGRWRRPLPGRGADASSVDICGTL